MKYEQNSNEMYAESWFKMHGFEIVSCKQYISRTKYVIKKNNIEMKWDLPYCVTDIKSYMQFCDNQFQMYCKLKQVI